VRDCYLDRWLDDTNTRNSERKYFEGNLMYRPEETFHVPTIRFFPQEVFFGNKLSGPQLVSDISKKCVVLYRYDYVKGNQIQQS